MSLRSATAALALTSGCITSVQVTQHATLATSDAATSFALTSHTGGTVSLAEQLAHGPVVLVFYRGFW